MKLLIYSLLFPILLLNIVFGMKMKNMDDPVVLVIHGGAGTILKKNMSEELEKQYTEVLTLSLQAGFAIINQGGSSVEAVEKAIHIMEDSPLFNAGKGAVFTNDGQNELDASIMNGATLNAGAVAGVTTVRNPISAAIAVMNKSDHVMMVGQGAEKFAQSAGMEIVDPEYFHTQGRWEALQKILRIDSSKTELDHDQAFQFSFDNKDSKFGTVGAVALDKSGNLAAGTSTGGMTNKKYGRIGDSPIIGAGNYANKNVGISCTGWGEYFIRSVAAYDVAALMEYSGLSVRDASKKVIDKIGVLGGNGGMIALDKHGNVAMPFNTEGMYRATITKSGKIDVQIYED